MIRLTEGPQLGMLGERMTLTYLKDKTFSYYGSAGATAGGGSAYHFNNNGQPLVKDDSDSGAEKQIFLVGIGRIWVVLQVIVVLKHRRKVKQAQPHLRLMNWKMVTTSQP